MDSSATGEVDDAPTTRGPAPRPVETARSAAPPPFASRVLWPPAAVEWFAHSVVLPAVHIVLDRIDLTQLIIDNVSLARIIEAADPDEVVARVNLSPIIERVLQEVDVAALVRGSSNSLLSDAVDGVRLQAANADGAVEHVVGHLHFRRRRRRAPAAPAAPS